MSLHRFGRGMLYVPIERDGEGEGVVDSCRQRKLALPELCGLKKNCLRSAIGQEIAKTGYY